MSKFDKQLTALEFIDKATILSFFHHNQAWMQSLVEGNIDQAEKHQNVRFRAAAINQTVCLYPNLNAGQNVKFAQLRAKSYEVTDSGQLLFHHDRLNTEELRQFAYLNNIIEKSDHT